MPWTGLARLEKGERVINNSTMVAGGSSSSVVINVNVGSVDSRERVEELIDAVNVDGRPVWAAVPCSAAPLHPRGLSVLSTDLDGLGMGLVFRLRARQ